MSAKLILTVALCAAAAPLSAQQPPIKRDVPAKLAAKAKISEDSAKTLAARKVPTGRIASLELEEEGGTLIWSMDMQVSGKTGIDEVNVNAYTGRTVMQHEGPAAEKAEAAADAKATRAAAHKKHEAEHEENEKGEKGEHEDSTSHR